MAQCKKCGKDFNAGDDYYNATTGEVCTLRNYCADCMDAFWDKAQEYRQYLFDLCNENDISTTYNMQNSTMQQLLSNAGVSYQTKDEYCGYV
jgi:hypothetical protein